MIRLAAALIFGALVIAALLLTEHRPPNADLPVVKASWQPPSPDDSRLYANCPVTPWALPTHSKEHIV